MNYLRKVYSKRQVSLCWRRIQRVWSCSRECELKEFLWVCLVEVGKWAGEGKWGRGVRRWQKYKNKSAYEKDKKALSMSWVERNTTLENFACQNSAHKECVLNWDSCFKSVSEEYSGNNVKVVILKINYLINIVLDF